MKAENSMSFQINSTSKPKPLSLPVKTQPEDIDSKMKMKKSQHILNTNEELKQLWLACYFERRLSKPVIQQMDLNHTLSIINNMVEREIIDFRVVAPLVLGLSKIFFRKMNYLLSESNSTLDNLRNPFSDQNLQGNKALGAKYREVAEEEGGRHKKKAGAGGQANYAKISKLFSLQNLHMPGLDTQAINELFQNADLQKQEALIRLGERTTMLDSTMMKTGYMKGEDVSSLMHPGTSYNMFGEIKGAGETDLRDRRNGNDAFQKIVESDERSGGKGGDFLNHLQDPSMNPLIEVRADTRDQRGAVDYSRMDLTFGGKGDQFMDGFDDLGAQGFDIDNVLEEDIFGGVDNQDIV